MSAEPELDPVIHPLARLRITTTLAALQPGDGLSFSRLQELLDLTAGNLTVHLRKLEEAGYITVTRAGAGRGARTTVMITPSGRQAFDAYVEALRSLLGPPGPA
jgi:DNA-binding MarR family transcriptional regulator